MLAFKPPFRPVPNLYGQKSIFLAGSIDMGTAIDWQDTLTNELSDLPVTIYNPRRDDFEEDAEQDISNKYFRDQVNWELDYLGHADVIAMYFDPQGKAPITLMELGLFASSKKCVVACPKGYWRRGNVQIVCQRFDIPLRDNLDDIIPIIRARLS